MKTALIGLTLLVTGGASHSDTYDQAHKASVIGTWECEHVYEAGTFRSETISLLRYKPSGRYSAMTTSTVTHDDFGTFVARGRDKGDYRVENDTIVSQPTELTYEMEPLRGPAATNAGIYQRLLQVADQKAQTELSKASEWAISKATPTELWVQHEDNGQPTKCHRQPEAST